MITTRIMPAAEQAYAYPLLIKRLLLSGVRYQPGQEIVYADQLRYSYTTLQTRIQRLANVLTEADVRPGDTVALLDWDSHRALECFFAVPMIGAVLHTVNVRLSAEQIRYTMNHAEDRLVLVHDDFLPLMEQLHGELGTVERFIRLGEGLAPVTGLNMIWVYGIGYVTSVGIGLLILHKLWRLASGRITDAELVEIRESEEDAIVHATADTAEQKEGHQP